MKTKVFKFMLPALAMVLAIGLSFATEAKRSAQTGYYDDPFIPGVQSIITDCEKQPSGDLCQTEEGYQLFDTPALNSVPNNELRRVE
ncbi:DUF6520 family protein [Mariniflexile jejuense]|uniref:DUF6520 family protein n=1 Tax=Mariniflexile jejuense TaxID=1173582 RepID=A0ABW3JPC9_9FLAO